VVIDTSALLAVFLEEPHAEWVAERFTEHAGELRMSTVNLTETLIRLRDRRPESVDEIEELLLEGGIRFIAPDAGQAKIAAEARFRYPLNLGDCFAYALASTQGGPILTLDLDFRSVDVEVLLPG
jgi:ribonuclease VapC